MSIVPSNIPPLRFNFYPPQGVNQPIAHVLLVHGAGAGVEHVFFRAVIDAFTQAGFAVSSANFAYMRQTLAGQRKVAPKAELLVEELQLMVQQLSNSPDYQANTPIVLAGKSMGGRVLSLLLAANCSFNPDGLSQVVAGLVLGYPLCPPAKNKDAAQAQLVSVKRTAHFEAVQKPLWLAQGSRDAFGDAAVLQSFCQDLPLVELWPQQGADHDFTTRKKDRYTQAELLTQIAEKVRVKVAALITAKSV